MSFKVGDKVIFNNGSFYMRTQNSGFIKNKEYTIIMIGYGANQNHYSLRNDYNKSIFIYRDSIKLSPRYMRNETIDKILK